MRNIKRFVIWIITAALLLMSAGAFSACSNDGSLLSKYSSLVNRGKVYSTQFLSGDFATVTRDLTSVAAMQFGADALESSWSSAVQNLGDYVSIADKKVSLYGQSIVVQIILKFANNGLNVTISFDGSNNNKVDGIWFTHYVLPMPPESNDVFQEVAVSVGPDSLDGVLTLPVGVSAPKVAVLLPDTITSDMDGTVGAAGNRVLRDLARGLAQHGIASVRYNMRYYQFPEQADSTAMTVASALLDDAAAAIAFAGSDSRLGGAVYVIGHGGSGSLVPKIAQDNPSVAGVVSLAGSPRRLEDIIFDQDAASINADANTTDDEKQMLLNYASGTVQTIKDLTPDSPDSVYFNFGVKYWLSLNAIDIPTIAASLQIPMLFLQGAADFEISPDADFGAWQTLLAGASNAQFKLYDGLNHQFMTTTGTAGAADYDTQNSVDAQVIGDIADWMNAG